jgi:hypothetical protein
VAKVKDGAPREAISEAIGHIEILIQPQGELANKKKAVNAAMEALMEAPILDMELWAKLAKGSFAIKDYANAIFAAKKAVSTLPVAFKDMNLVDLAACHPGLASQAIHYWMMVAETIHGQGLMMLIQKG